MDYINNPQFYLTLFLGTIFLPIIFNGKGKLKFVLYGTILELFVYFVLLALNNESTEMIVNKIVYSLFYFPIWIFFTSLINQIIDGKKTEVDSKSSKIWGEELNNDTKKIEKELDEIEKLYTKKTISSEEREKMRNKILGID